MGVVVWFLVFGCWFDCYFVVCLFCYNIYCLFCGYILGEGEFCVGSWMGEFCDVFWLVVMGLVDDLGGLDWCWWKWWYDKEYVGWVNL